MENCCVLPLCFSAACRSCKSQLGGRVKSRQGRHGSSFFSCRCQTGLTETHYPPSQELLSGQSCIFRWLPGYRGGFYCVESFGRVEFLERLFFFIELFTFIFFPLCVWKENNIFYKTGQVIVSPNQHHPGEPQEMEFSAGNLDVDPCNAAVISFSLCVCLCLCTCTHVSPRSVHLPIHTLVFMERCYFGVFVWSNKPQTPK